MNERIRKLYQEAKSFYLTDEYILPPSEEDCELIGQKFAELIVKECMDVCESATQEGQPLHLVSIGYADRIKKTFRS